MTNTHTWVACVIGGLVAGWLLSSVVPGSLFSGIYSTVVNEFAEGISVDGTTVINGSGEYVGEVNSTVDGTIGGGTLNVTTSNSATSTIIGGCFQFYATSTATAHKFQASTTPGYMVSQYGTCPNL